MQKVYLFPLRSGLFSVSQSFICAAFSLRRNSTKFKADKTWSVAQREKKSWFYLIILHLVSFSSLFPFCSPQFCAHWIWMLLLCSIRGTLNILAKPLNFRVSMYMDLVRKPLGIKLWRMTQIETFTNSHRIRTHTWKHISCSKCPLFLNNEGQRKCVRQRSDGGSGCVWLV